MSTTTEKQQSKKNLSGNRKWQDRCNTNAKVWERQQLLQIQSSIIRSSAEGIWEFRLAHQIQKVLHTYIGPA